MATYDKDFIRENLTSEDMYELLTELGGEPIQHGEWITSRTICHCGDSHKLYWYSNTHLFKCFTKCPEDSFDVFELIKKVKHIELHEAIDYIAIRFNFDSINSNFSYDGETLQDWEIFNRTIKKSEQNNKQIVKLEPYNGEFLKHFPRPHIAPWLKEGISEEVMNHRGICYDPFSQGIVIPHYDKDGTLIGIRERTMIKDEEAFGKYRPAIINGKMYNHPLGFNLYNLNNSKDNIARMKTAIVFEGEKSTLLYASIFGEENDITVAVCGSNLINYQFNLLRELGTQEIIIGFDKQFKEIGDEEWKKWTAKLIAIHNKYSNYCKISFLFDKENLLGYKCSPVDCGKDKFLMLYKNRIML